MKKRHYLPTLAFVASTITSAIALAGPPPPGYNGCTSVGSGTTATGQLYETWLCDEGYVTCYDNDGDGVIDYSDPATGQGSCKVSAGNS